MLILRADDEHYMLSSSIELALTPVWGTDTPDPGLSVRLPSWNDLPQASVADGLGTAEGHGSRVSLAVAKPKPHRY